jgi:hypothetical protein
MFRFKAIASLALLLLLVGAAYLFYREKPLDVWRAVTPAYLKEALAEPESLSHVPFCETIRADQKVSALFSCQPWFSAHLRDPICALQNLGPKGWEPGVVKGDAEKAGAAIGTWAEGRGCKEIVLDIESTNDRALTTRWIQIVSQKLKARFPTIRVIVAVHGKIDDAGSWAGAKSQDWPALCQISDELLLMAYDFHYPGVSSPGETAPIQWVEEVLRYALTTCPKEKLRLGLAAYGYNFKTKAVITERKWRESGSIADPNVFVETRAQREEKILLAKKLGVRKFFLWAAGMEDPAQAH